MLEPLKTFVRTVTDIVDETESEQRIVPVVGAAMKSLVSSPDWLPEEFSRCSPTTYSQYLLYCDPRERFCVVSFVWGPGQKTPIHDHTVWGVIGQLVGEETSQSFEFDSAGSLIEIGEPDVLRRGDIALLSPSAVDIHLVSNASDRVAISIHAYGANIGKVSRNTYNISSGHKSTFISSYTNDKIPNIWR